MAVVVALLAILAFFLLPIIPYNKGYLVGQATYELIYVRVSTSFFVINCGVAIDKFVAVQSVGNGSQILQWRTLEGPMLVCSNQLK